MATWVSASKCVHLLLRPPYSCHVQSKRDYHHLLEQAIDRGDCATSVELALFAKEPLTAKDRELESGDLFDRSAVVHFLLGTRKVRCDDYSKLRCYPFQLSGICLITNEPIKNVMSSDVGSLQTLTLLSQLLLSNATREEEDCFWSIVKTSSPDSQDQASHLIEHLTENSTYPNCAYSDPERAYWASEVFGQAIFRWIAHRHVDAKTRRLNPLRLVDQCRVEIRRFLMQLLDQQPDKNYVQLVHNLPLPPRLRNFLLFRELWPPIGKCIDNRLVETWSDHRPIIDQCYEKILFTKSPTGVYIYTTKGWQLPLTDEKDLFNLVKGRILGQTNIK